ncbi:MAG: hypothetical protein ACK559_18940, partial [bacterium]
MMDLSRDRSSCSFEGPNPRCGNPRPRRVARSPARGGRRHAPRTRRHQRRWIARAIDHVVPQGALPSDFTSMDRRRARRLGPSQVQGGRQMASGATRGRG